ncbi:MULTISPECIES: hypothetical protein [unclassified Corallococcus]|uniref:hypothetical protein n=1 Tax=unclassified Corallococcus TaxID=2685029 RepID=UPI001A8FD10F|nr:MULTISPECIES: hypothetical protein [unclassified Corallococcus]MBN9682878.1 hypothetical protein [Corallococcus sp. NCSPR001]WAS85585.1 hypothetical protein O0N60_01120 [Corallococcus sp. NCRR]
MPFPPRLAHLATKAVVVAKLGPTYADAHRVDPEEAAQRLSTALKGPLLTSLLEATWTQMLGSTKRLKEEGLLEKVATTLADRPQRPGKVATVTAGWSAFLILVDLEVGTASDAARRVMESDEGRKRAAAGIKEVAGFLAQELTRGR